MPPDDGLWCYLGPGAVAAIAALIGLWIRRRGARSRDGGAERRDDDDQAVLGEADQPPPRRRGRR